MRSGIPARNTHNYPWDDPDHAMMIQHEAIKDFKNPDGEVIGMMSMTMPFPVGPGVSLEGIQPGDTVQFTFELRWKGKPPFQLTSIQKLPADTKLDFGSDEDQDKAPQP